MFQKAEGMRRGHWVCLGLCFLWLGFTPAKAQEPLSFGDIFNIGYASSPALSPTGEWVAVTKNGFNIRTDTPERALELIRFDGEERFEVSPADQHASDYAWSPQQDVLAFVANVQGSRQIHLYSLAQRTFLCSTQLSSPPTSLSWSPDAQHIAYVRSDAAETRVSLIDGAIKAPDSADWARAPREIERLRYRYDKAGFRGHDVQRLYTVDSDCSNERRVSKNDIDHAGPYAHASAPSWSIDGKHIYISRITEDGEGNRRGNSDIYAYRLRDGAARRVTNGAGDENGAAVSPDGKWLAYRGLENNGASWSRSDLFILPTHGGKAVNLTGGYGRSVEGFSWAPDSDGLIYAYRDQGKAMNARVTRTGERTELFENVGSGIRPYLGYGGAELVSLSQDATRFAAVRLHSDRPSEVYVGETAASLAAVKRITDYGGYIAAGRQVGKVEEIWTRSSTGDHDIQAWMIKPPNFDERQQYPMILEVHGGPYAAYGPHYSYDTQVLAAKGFIVVIANPSGSIGYGEAFAQRIDFQFPIPDFQDLMDVVTNTSNVPFVDQKRLFIAGGSGGGLVTAWAIGKTDRFKAAVSYYPIADWVSFALTADRPYRYTRVWNRSFPWEDRESYWRRSPLSNVGDISTPLLIFTGEKDFRTPISQSELLFSALRLEKVDAMLVRVPEESHGVATRPSNLARRFAYITRWFEKYGARLQ